MKHLAWFSVVAFLIFGLAGDATAQVSSRITYDLGVTYVADNDIYKDLYALNAGGGVYGRWAGFSMRSELSTHLFNVGDQFEIGRPLFRVGVGNFFGLGAEFRHAYFLTATSEIKGFYLNLRYGTISRENAEESHRYIDFSIGKRF